jgi:hypothetical protein
MSEKTRIFFSIMVILAGFSVLLAEDCRGCDDPYRLAPDGNYYPVPDRPGAPITYGSTLFFNRCSPEAGHIEAEYNFGVLSTPAEREHKAGIKNYQYKDRPLYRQDKVTDNNGR